MLIPNLFRLRFGGACDRFVLWIYDVHEAGKKKVFITKSIYIVAIELEFPLMFIQLVYGIAKTCDRRQ